MLLSIFNEEGASDIIRVNDVSNLLVLLLCSCLLFNFVRIDKFTLLFRDYDLNKILLDKKLKTLLSLLLSSQACIGLRVIVLIMGQDVTHLHTGNLPEAMPFIVMQRLE